ncbi:hypothetical protein [Actinoplanes sp. G11-F43]|uniref:hypothetical protein n=1 Tax=Actinoplanes sp. G11-F43 TaxID=3424130 RepID=UPI003D35700B
MGLQAAGSSSGVGWVRRVAVFAVPAGILLALRLLRAGLLQVPCLLPMVAAGPPGDA